MKLKSVFLAIPLLLISASAFAQLSTGEPSATVIRTGNRAQEGNFGLYVGVKTSMFKDLFDGNVSVKAMPLLNFKYMYTDNVEFRVGLDFYSKTNRLNGEVPAGEYNETTSVKNTNGSTDFMVYPGIAYHFNKLNIFDIYVGAELPLGGNGTSVYSGYGNYSEKVTKRSFVIGLGAFVGIQAYLGRLPLALGVEYGLSSQFDTGLKYKHQINNEGNTQTYFTTDPSEFTGDGRYDTLKAKKGTLGNQIRLTFTYYFK